MTPSLAVPLVLGLLCGGLINLFADVLPHDQRLARPSCPECGKARPWLDFITGRACRSCGHQRGLRSWIVIVAALAVSAFTWFQAPAIGYYLGMFLFGYLAVVTVIDIEHRLILGSASVFGGVLALGLGWYMHGPWSTLLGALAGLLIMGAFYYLGVLFSRVRAGRLQRAGRPVDNEEALGSGDVTLAIILGLLLGWPLIWFGLLLGVLLGGLFGLLIVIVQLVRGRYADRALSLFMPYGPSFILSAFLIMYLPKTISGLIPQ
jgi:prepilin signal peptidase PulO-like enzyme (type II secretory pathway)